MVNSFWYISWDKISLLWSCWCRWINSIKGVISCTIFRILFLSFGLAFAKAKICNHFGMQFYILDCYSKNKTKNTLEMQETTASIKSFLCNIQQAKILSLFGSLNYISFNSSQPIFFFFYVCTNMKRGPSIVRIVPSLRAKDWGSEYYVLDV